MANWNPKTRIGRYLKNNFIAADQALGALVGYDPDETISSHLGKLEDEPGGIPRNRPVARMLAWTLNKIQRNHCHNAIEKDEGKDCLRDEAMEKKYQEEAERQTYHGE